MTPFGQTSVRTTTIRHHTERGTATTAHNARFRVTLTELFDALKRLKLLVMHEAQYP